MKRDPPYDSTHPTHSLQRMRNTGCLLYRSARDLLLKLDAGVLYVTLNRPDSQNAMSLKMVPLNCGGVCLHTQPGYVHWRVLRGAGGHFCAGGDIKDMAGARSKASRLSAS